MLWSIKARARSPILAAAAQWELEGPRITGPMTSLKMLGNLFIQASTFSLKKWL
jgi:hypothetical protein